MSDVNEVRLVGKVDGEVKHRVSEKGTSVVNMTIATMGRGRYPDRHRCVAFGATADSLRGLAAGEAVSVVGRLQTRSYEREKGSGVKAWITEVVVDRAGEAPRWGAKHREETAPVSDDDAGVPF
jgi:single-strand DNA-binding protein